MSATAESTGVPAPCSRAQARTPAPKGRLHSLSIRAKLATMVVAFSAAIIGLLAIMNISLNLAAGVRGYVQGEGLWSKGQKDGVYWLLRYLRTRDEQDYLRYSQSIRMPLGDRDARIELGKPSFDASVVQRGFLEGGNSAADIPDMVSLFRRFGNMEVFSPAIAVWSEADSYVLRLLDCGSEVHSAITSGRLTRGRQDQLLAQLDDINANLTRLENQFSSDFGDGAREMQKALTGLILASALVLLCCGLLVSWWISRGIEDAIQRLRVGALLVSAGNLDHHIEARSNDELGELAGIFNEMVTHRRQVEAYIHHAAQHDALTGLPNRALLLDRLDMAIRQSRRHGGQVAVLMIDLDHFKRINDSLGHQFGDQFLLRVSEQLKKTMRDTDTVSRFGGDEFVIVLTEVQCRDQLTSTIAKITDAIAKPVMVEGHELLVTSSIGGCLYPQDGDNTSALLKHADVAMYHAKAAGRGNIQWFTEAMLQETAERLAIGSALRHAVGNQELSLHYQPEVCLKSGRVVGMEALMRWKHPQRGFIGPNRFIPVAEETGEIIALGQWALQTACHEAARIQSRTGQPLVMAVNVSPRQFQQQDWIETVRTTLKQSGLAPEHLELEITEGMLMRNPEESAAMLRRLRSLGVMVVIDDFGTGYSSLSYLTRFPVDKIKIDRSFVRGVTTNAADAAIVNAIIAMALSLNIRIIAEGVESQAQQTYLRERGCDEAQGFYYSAAVPVEGFLALAA